MKKTLLSIFALAILLPFASQAQLVVSVGGGYGITAPNDVMGTRTVVSSTGETTLTNLYGTVGGGINVGADVGYMFNDHIGAVLGINYLLGSTVSATEVEAPTQTVMAEAYSNQLRLSPQAILQTNGETINIYGRAGFLIPVMGTTFISIDSWTDLGGGVEIENQQRDEAKGAFSLGYTGAFGAEYRINEMIGIFLEAQAVSLNIKSNSRETVEYMTNGSDVLGNLTVSQREISYVDELTPASNNATTNTTSFDNDQPTEELAVQSPYSAFFINLGVKLRLGGGE